MSKFKLAFTLLSLFLVTSEVHALSDLSLISIDKIGYENLQKIKNHESIEWWVEMGEHLVVEIKGQDIKLPDYIEIKTTRRQVDLSSLVFESSGHCSHEPGQEKAHTSIKEIFIGASFKLVSTDGMVEKLSLINHKKLIPFEKNRVLSFQIENRPPNKTINFDPTIENLVNQVDQDRWFEQVEYLASLNRMENNDLEIAGFWLLDKFQSLGLEASTYERITRPGFNVFGFKQGTTRADEWYVVGAHLDSVNEDLDLTLPSPGAEDNASGCSGVLEIANVLSQYETEASIMFVCFHAEEWGLKGSYDVVKLFQENGDLNKIKTMFNMDMIGYQMGGKYTAVAGTRGVENLSLVENMATNGQLYTDLDWQVNTNKCCTDFISFLNVDVPAMDSSEPHLSSYFAYHSKDDVPQNVDPKMGSGIVKAHVATLAQLVGVHDQENIHEITPAHSGMWYNPEQSGHGVTVEILPGNRILLVWYVFDESGNQIWLVGAGDYQGDAATVAVSISQLGIFPPNFVSEDVETTVWGTLQLVFEDCQTAMFSWQPNEDAGFSAGQMNMKRLTGIDGMVCE